ncbi:hypothetical protein BTUL_0228g00080 [Botrytis tulipae]|uniref:Uncharacterized protein n=1 Tax=Botrytis tulipae TaxID=87230 RepID=A0A4Z1EFR3_9HELO|nr:hypothetical protein BTUL_0228g00080 [Botrytis tulipae]
MSRGDQPKYHERDVLSFERLEQIQQKKTKWEYFQAQRPLIITRNNILNPQTRIAPQMSYEQLKRRIVYLEEKNHKLEGQLDASDLRSRMWWTDVENYYKGMKKDSEEFQRKVDQRQVRFRNAMRKSQDHERAIREYEERT